MADQLVLREFRAAIPGAAGVQVFRPGDTILDTDPSYAQIVSAAPDSGLKAYPLNLTMTNARNAAIEARLRGVPDEEVQTNLLAAAASGGVG